MWQTSLLLTASLSVGGSPLIGVLALQGDVREHRKMLESLGANVVEIRTPEHLSGITGLVLPGGESSVMDKLTRLFGLRDPLIELIGQGIPVLGTCAGMIMVADDIEDAIEGQLSLGGLDVTVRRNAFGSQKDSFDVSLSVDEYGPDPVDVSFIRAPAVTRVGDGVRALAMLDDGRIVAVANETITALAFHPEVTGETRFHQRFIGQAQAWSSPTSA
jgi:5'-phosphate synthase pdxT subunit